METIGGRKGCLRVPVPESGLRSLFSQTLMMKWLTQSVPTTVRTCVIYSQCSRCHLDLASLVEPPTLEVSLSLLRLTQPQPMISSMRSSLMLNTWVPWQLVLSHAPTQILMALVMSRMLVEEMSWHALILEHLGQALLQN